MLEVEKLQLIQRNEERIQKLPDSKPAVGKTRFVFNTQTGQNIPFNGTENCILSVHDFTAHGGVFVFLTFSTGVRSLLNQPMITPSQIEGLEEGPSGHHH